MALTHGPILRSLPEVEDVEPQLVENLATRSHKIRSLGANHSAFGHAHIIKVEGGVLVGR